MKQNGRFTALVLLSLLAPLFLFPLAVTAAGSFMTEEAVMVNYSSRITTFDLAAGITKKFRRLLLVPVPASVEQYAEVLINQPAFLVLLLNSLKITVPVTLGALLVSILSAWGFTRWRWKHREKLFTLYVTVMLLPLQAVLVPNYITASLLGIQKSPLAIILPGIFSPFGVFLLRQGMRAIPASCIEAAEMDGAGNGCILFHVVIPQLKTSLAALMMLVFIEYWNVVEQAIIFIDDFRKEPLSVYLSRLTDGRAGLVFAASCVYLFVPLWFLFWRQKDLEKGIELSGVR